MKGIIFFGLAIITALAVVIGCKRAAPILPKRPLPPGTFQMQFTSKITGPVELVIDGVRIPVEQKKKKARRLTISGLSQGKRHYYISSHIDMIGPDMGEVEIGPETGVFQVHFTQRLKTATYDDARANAHKPEDIPGVKAVLE